MKLLLACLGLLLLLAAGHVIASLLGLPRVLPRPRRDFVAFALGNCAICLQLFTFAAFGLPLTLPGLLLPWLLLALMACVFRPQRQADHLRCAHATVPGIPAWLLLVAAPLLVGGIGGLFVHWLAEPFPLGDGIAYWMPKVKVFWIHRDAPAAAWGELERFPYAGQGPLVPFTQLWLCLIMGELNEYWTKLLIPMYGAGLIVGVALFTARAAGPSAGLIGGALMAATPILLTRTEYGDLALAFFFWLACALLIAWTKAEQRPQQLLVAAAVLAGTCTWVKLEGNVLAAIFLGMLGAALAAQDRKQPRARPFCIAAIIVLVIAIPWWIARWQLGYWFPLEVASERATGEAVALRLLPALDALRREMFGLANVLERWNVFWYAFWAMLVVHLPRLPAELRPPILGLLAYLAAAVTVVAAMPVDLAWLSDLFGRLLIHVHALPIYVLAAMISRRLGMEARAGTEQPARGGTA